DGDRDPLQIYIDYLNWMHDVYPEGPSIDSGYDNVLKEAADKFQDVTKYKNDLRYLKIWLELARKKPEPRNIFHFLIQKDIGQQKSLFYENYALYHEEREEYDAVKEVFKTGIAKCAHPLERLQRLYNEFKCRF
ncbi:Mad3/BUB1 homology region 1, partial [Pilobolus umbonatus]